MYSEIQKRMASLNDNYSWQVPDSSKVQKYTRRKKSGILNNWKPMFSELDLDNIKRNPNRFITECGYKNSVLLNILNSNSDIFLFSKKSLINILREIKIFNCHETDTVELKNKCDIDITRKTDKSSWSTLYNSNIYKMGSKTNKHFIKDLDKILDRIIPHTMMKHDVKLDLDIDSLSSLLEITESMESNCTDTSYNFSSETITEIFKNINNFYPLNDFNNCEIESKHFGEIYKNFMEKKCYENKKFRCKTIAPEILESLIILYTSVLIDKEQKYYYTTDVLKRYMMTTNELPYLWTNDFPLKCYYSSEQYSTQILVTNDIYNLSDNEVLHIFREFNAIDVTEPTNFNMKFSVFVKLSRESDVQNLIKSCLGKRTRTSRLFMEVILLNGKKGTVEIILFPKNICRTWPTSNSRFDLYRYAARIECISALLSIQDLYTIFDKFFGNVKCVTIYTDSDGFSKNGGLVSFNDEDALIKAVSGKYIFIRTSVFESRLIIKKF